MVHRGRRERGVLTCVLILLMATTPGVCGALAAQEKSPEVQKAGERANARKKPAGTEVERLRTTVTAQQQEIQALREEAARRDAALRQVESELSTIRAGMPPASRLSQLTATTREQAAAIADLQRQVTELQRLLRQIAGDQNK